jgi:hypothetical protein
VSTRTILCLVAAGASLTGCSALGTPATRTATTASVARAQSTHEYPSPTPHRRAATGATAATAAAAIFEFARAYINWNARTVAADMRALAARSIGQARSALELAAAQTANDYELRRGGIANSGSVEAIAPLAGGGANRYLVVTREATTATATDAYRGLRPAWHVAIATVTSMPGGRWVLSGWQPET